LTGGDYRLTLNLSPFSYAELRSDVTVLGLSIRGDKELSELVKSPVKNARLTIKPIVEIEVFQINDSALAPHFNVVAKPNDWSRGVGTRIKGLESGKQNPLRQMYLEYWGGLHDYLVENEKGISIRSCAWNSRETADERGLHL
jgi:hypothetical protein